LPNSRHLHQTSLTYGAFMIEYTFDTTRMAAHLMFTGALDRFPRIRYILAHEGGTLPYLAWRLYVAQKITPHRFPQWSYEELKQRVGHFYYDTAMSAGPEMTQCLLSMVPLEQVVYGSDWPFVNPTSVSESVKNLSPQGFLSEAQTAAISRNNALKLFPRLAERSAKAGA
jgi:predicted TIM-barrel fold metal-dependent hydrolase